MGKYHVRVTYQTTITVCASNEEAARVAAIKRALAQIDRGETDWGAEVIRRPRGRRR